MLKTKKLVQEMGKVNFRDLNIFGLKAKVPPEIKGRSSGAKFGTESSVCYLRDIQFR